jgi:hypothetical protein
MSEPRDDSDETPQPAERAGDVPSHEVDVTLIDEMLRMSPTERLRQNDRMAALALVLQQAFAGRRGG